MVAILRCMHVNNVNFGISERELLQHLGLVHLGLVHLGLVHLGLVHLGLVHLGLVQRFNVLYLALRENC